MESREPKNNGERRPNHKRISEGSQVVIYNLADKEDDMSKALMLIIGFVLAATILVALLCQKLLRLDRAEESTQTAVEEFAIFVAESVINRYNGGEILPFVAITQDDLPELVKENVSSFGSYLHNHLGHICHDIVSRRQRDTNGNWEFSIEKYTLIHR